MDPDKGYLVLGRTLNTIGNAIRSGQGGQIPTQFRHRAPEMRRYEGVLLEDLHSAESIDEPAKAQFQVKSMVFGSEALSDERTLEVWSRAMGASFRQGAYGWAVEFYPDIFYWVPMDCSPAASSSEG